MPRFSIIAILLLLLSGCYPERPPAQALPEVSPEEREEALALAEAADRASLEAAFDRLSRHPHTLRERLHQFDADGRVNAYRRRTVDVDGPERETVFAEQEGTFDFGAFGRFVSFEDMDRLPENPVPFLLPEDPPYLTARGREAYRFALAPDTTIGGRAVRVVRVDALPDEGDDQAVRGARLFVDSATGDLVGVILRRASQNVLFGEQSTLELMLAPGPGGGWLPRTTDYRVAVRAALTATRRFQLQRDYSYEAPLQVAMARE